MVDTSTSIARAMNEPHDELWCDRQLAHAERVLQYLRVRDSAVIERVHAVQLLALQQSRATRKVLGDFQMLLDGTANYRALLLNPEPSPRQSQHIPEKHFPLQPSGGNVSTPSPGVPGVESHSEQSIRKNLVPGAKEIPVNRDSSAKTDRQSASYSSAARPSLKGEVSSFAYDRNNLVPALTPSSHRVGTVTATGTGESRVNSFPRVRSNNTSQKQSSIAARELSEARLRVLNRRRVVAERKKNTACPLPASGRSSQPQGRTLSKRDAFNPQDSAMLPPTARAGGRVAPSARPLADPMRVHVQRVPILGAPQGNRSTLDNAQQGRRYTPAPLKRHSPREMRLASAAGLNDNLRRQCNDAHNVRQKDGRMSTAYNVHQNASSSLVQLPPRLQHRERRPSGGIIRPSVTGMYREPIDMGAQIGPRRFVPSGAQVPRQPGPRSRGQGSLHRILKT